jgi:PPOX class probable F420-dependent enzyme
MLGRRDAMAELTDELRALLAERRYAVLATHDPNDRIHLTPIWFLFEDDTFYFESFSASRKVENLRRTASASVVVDVRDPGRERWVSAAGPVEIVTGDEAREINARIRRRYLTPEALEDERIEPVFAMADDVTLSLTPADWRAWDSKELDTQFFGGILGAAPERWFLPVEA